MKLTEEALELADELKDVADVLGSNNIEATVIGKGADMIRKLVAELDKHQDKSLDELMKWQQELDKQGEPVGWLNNTTTFSEVNTGLGGKALIDTTPQTKPHTNGIK